MSHTPFFRLAFNLEIPRPSPTAIPHANDEEYNANNTDNTMATATGTDDNEQRGVLLLPKNKDKHFLRSVREHPRFSLRVTAIFVLIIGLVLNAIVTDNFWDWRIRHVIEPATPTLAIFLVWQLTDLFFERLFKYKIPNWVIGLVETVGFVVFLGLFVLAQIGIDEIVQGRLSYYRQEGVMVAYDSMPWAIAFIIHAIIVGQCVVKFTKYRSANHRCVECGRKAGAKGKATDVGDEEENLTGGNDGEAGPSGYRDEVEENPTTQA